MSMSALGNQLSALASSKSTSAGFVHSTSRANNDGIGRGFHHSNRHGYSTGNSDAVGGADDVTRVPSVLFENAREAAEVTVATLRENAVNAWESLTRDVVVNNNNNNIANSESNSDGDGDDAAALFSIHNLENFERGTSTSQRNLQVDESIEKALSLIMTMTAEHPPSSINNDDINSNPILLSCLHVIEYLLRKYRIHSRPSTASALLSAFLPLQMAHPTAYPRLFGRVLALIDLQDVPHWTFARMYAARDAPPLSRGVLAKHVARDEALAIAMVSMAKKATEIGLSEEGGINNSNNNNGGGARSRRGISAILSATASVLTEALYLQSTNKTNGPDAGAREGTVRALFPSILSACKSDATGERKEWGRILASTIAGLCPLSAEARVALCDAIADGMPAVADGTGAWTGREADDASSGVMTLLSVLGSMGDGDDAGNEDGWERYLPMLPPSKKRNGTKRKKKRTVVDCLGCELHSSTYRRLVGKDNVASMAMGAVLQSTNAEDADGNAFVEERMAPLAASLIMHAFQNMEKEAREAFEGDAVSTPSKKKKKKKGGDGNAERDVQLILNLIEEPALASLWRSKHSALVAAVAVRAIASYDGLYQSSSDAKSTDSAKSSAAILERYASVLKALSATDSAVYDQAVAYAISTVAATSSKNSSRKSLKDDEEHRMARLARLLGRDDVASSIATVGANASGNDDEEAVKMTDDDDDLAVAYLLPARVALEHANASVRLSAVSRLKSSFESNGGDGGDGKEGVASMVEGDLGRALLRRLVTDDDCAVASAAGRIFAGALKRISEEASDDTEDAMEMDGDDRALLEYDSLNDIAQEALASLLRWTYIGKEGDVWSPPEIKTASTESTKKKKKKSKKKADANVDSPLLSCISICGSVVKLISELVCNDDGDLEEDHPLSDLFCRLFLSLGAHVGYAANVRVADTPQPIERASDAALDELSRLTGGVETRKVDTTDFITMDSISQQVLSHFFSLGQAEKKVSEKMTSPKLLQSRFLWLALSSYSDLVGSRDSQQPSSMSRILRITLDLALYQMHSYGKESKNSSSTTSSTFQLEVSFLRETCSRYFHSPAIVQQRDACEEAILKLASTPSTMAFEEIVKPAISGLLGSHVTKKYGDLAPGGLFSVFLHACLRPRATKEGTLRILVIVASEWGSIPGMDPSTAVRDYVLPAVALMSHSDRAVRERAMELLEKIPSAVAGDDDEIVSGICGKATDRSSPLRSSLGMDGADALPRLLGRIVSSTREGSASAAPSAALQKLLIESVKSCALGGEKNATVFNNGGCQAAAVVLSSMEKAGEAAFPLSKRWEFAGRELFRAFLSYDQKEGDEQRQLAVLPSICRLRDSVLSMLKGVLVNEAQSGGGEDGGLNIQITIGPSPTGRRVRSYSIGSSDMFATLEPYPESMLKAILQALSPSSQGATSHLDISTNVIQSVILRPSWSNGVFPKLSAKSKNDVASALLALRARNDDESAGRALLGLPLKSPDLLRLLEGVGDASLRSEIDQAAVVFVTDCVRGKLDVLGNSISGALDISKLSSKLFEHLLSLSSTKNLVEGSDSGGRDYTRVSILQTLFAIHSRYQSRLAQLMVKEGSVGKHASASKRKRSRSQSDVGSLNAATTSRANLLVGLVGGNAATIDPLNSGRGRTLSLSLLTCLCEESPSAVVTSLLPALMSLAGTLQTDGADQRVDTKGLGDALVAIVPAYCAHARSANLSLFSLLEDFVGRIIVPHGSSENEKWRCNMLDHLVDALKLLPTKESSSEAVASLAACVMALQAFNIQKPKTTSSNDTDSEMSDDAEHNPETRLDLRVLANTTRGIKIQVSLSLLQYAEKLMSYICGLSSFSGENSSRGNMAVDVSEVAALALRGSGKGKEDGAYSTLSEAQQRSILYLAINLLQSVRDELSTPKARNFVRKSKGDDADVCLRLWNELMQTHASTVRAKHAKLLLGMTMSSAEKRFWDAAPIATSECLESLQNLLPVPHFLASVSSILTGEEEDASHFHKKKIIKLLADRVAEVSSDSPEASLFLEMVPDLVAQVNLDPSTMAVAADGKDSSASSMRRTIVMQQGALIAIESFARSLYPSTENGKLAASAAAVFLPALASVTKLLDDTALSWIKANDGNVGNSEVSSGVADAQCQLLSSSSLCVSTLVTTLKARCLPQLPTIIKPLVKSLKSANILLLEGSNDPAASSTGELLQLSILKTLQAIAETMPQFLLPYLSLIFSNNGLPSKALRQGYEHGVEHSVRTAVAQLETALATKVQVRQLIPALGQALAKNLRPDGYESWEEACSIMNVMTIAVESSQRSVLSPVIGKIFNGLVMAYGYEGDGESTPRMLQSANKCLLSLVMKLSESQLRPLYARLREWRGNIEDAKEGSLSSSARRYAFWSLSAELSKSLRSIFLPCLTSVLTDVIDELEIAVSLLCQRTKKKTDGSKRRRVEESDSSADDMEKVKSLQPLLLCLESALKADAHEGGDWTRGDDNQRYNMILNHLGKLLLAQVPKETPLLSDLTSKEKASTSAYQQIVQGVGTLEYGNVVGCLTALAAAAGNEQLWKPLNFAVLEACGHERNEVRKAGIGCLLSIIETIGEEYMVLLPECLPVISELLEDDEDTAAMAKECVRQGEELLGESLEDSLR